MLIALLLVPLMGVGALALDISAQHAERTQLQLGADAAALAVAASCSINAAECGATAEEIANNAIAANGGTPVPGGAEIEWIGDDTVRVWAAAEFPHFLASLVDDDADPASTLVRARADAAWGVPDGGATIPLAVAECELEKHFDPDSEEGEPFILRLIGPGKAPEDCAPGYPGGFGWLEGDDVDGDGDADCEVEVEAGEPEPGVPGASDTKAGGCPDDYIAELIGTTVLVPLYDAYTPGSAGSSGSYNITRFAAFYITGYHIASGKCVVPPNVKDKSSCYVPGEVDRPGFKGGEFGLQGYFLRYVSIGEEFEDDEDEETPDGGLGTARLIG